jgi:hypothetical protein
MLLQGGQVTTCTLRPSTGTYLLVTTIKPPKTKNNKEKNVHVNYRNYLFTQYQMVA